MPTSSNNHPTLVLVGSGEFTPAMVATDRYLLGLIKHPSPVVAVIPLAAGRETDCYKWIHQGTKHFNRLGAQVIGVRILNRTEANQPGLVKPLYGADVIYFSGGDPGYLFSSLKGTLLWQQVSRRFRDGVILAGASAGAMVFGKYLLSNPYVVSEQEALPRWVTAFNLAPYTILPHYDFLMREEKSLFHSLLTHLPPRIKPTLLGIDENTALLIRGGDLKTLGQGYLQCPRSYIIK